MSGSKKNDGSDRVREEYDFSSGQRGKYAKQFEEGTNLVALDDDIAAAFPDSESVNRALRALLDFARRAVRKPTG
jgi:hypothetical protein